jgi:acylphosphatase
VSGSSIGPETIARRVLVSGQVQGVTFRAATAREALRYPGLRGYVRNLPSGEVEVILQGSATAVDAMIEWCHQGPPQAHVEQVRVWESSVDPALPHFMVK